MKSVRKILLLLLLVLSLVSLSACDEGDSDITVTCDEVAMMYEGWEHEHFVNHYHDDEQCRIDIDCEDEELVIIFWFFSTSEEAKEGLEFLKDITENEGYVSKRYNNIDYAHKKDKAGSIRPFDYLLFTKTGLKGTLLDPYRNK